MLGTLDVSADSADNVDAVADRDRRSCSNSATASPTACRTTSWCATCKISRAPPSSTAAILQLLLAGVAAVSLIVGGIGIMNIMLVSVTERTREIGLRLAVGARRSAILWQFLIEAVALSTAGGAIGVVFGVLGARRRFRSARTGRPAVPLSAVLFSVAFSALVGVFFGYYPAAKASRLDPIVALRFE